MKQKVYERLEALRELMRRERVAAFIFSSSDPHNSEYVPDRWKGREWISGFDGSAGTVVVTLKHAALWTDSRYFLAAEVQLKDTGIELMKLKMPGTPSVSQWIAQEIYDENDGGITEIGVDGRVNSHSFVEQLKYDLQQSGITVRTNWDPLEELWLDRPDIPNAIIHIHPLKYAGEDAISKIKRIRHEVSLLHGDGILISSLDDIAWTLNLRGTDVHCNPVFVSYLLIEPDKVVLFVDANKLTLEVKQYLCKIGVSVLPYNSISSYLHKDYLAYNILLDPDVTNSYLVNCVDRKRVKIVFGHSPVPAMKAVKNSVEIEGFHQAMLRDGVAMVKFLKWLQPAIEAGGQTEISLDRKLTSLRAQQALFKDISFDTIVGYEAHGAIVHYEATPETDATVDAKGLVLIDSGAQYEDGTTDITRTIALGPVTEEQRHIYTLVLKGHIQLELAKFPVGVSGTQIDALSREAMWREGFNFLHGTGHGVGSYLNVHEGPHQIRMEFMPAPLHAGMIVTDEPGLYLSNKFGVRIENTLLIKKYMNTEFGEFLQMEPLTLCPIDLTPVDITMLLPEEVTWLNNYHQLVYAKLSPYLSVDEREWLKNATKAVEL